MGNDLEPIWTVPKSSCCCGLQALEVQEQVEDEKEDLMQDIKRRRCVAPPLTRSAHC